MVNNDYHLSTEYESQEQTKLPCHNVTGIDIIAAVITDVHNKDSSIKLTGS